MAVWYSLWSFGIFFPTWYDWTKKIWQTWCSPLVIGNCCATEFRYQCRSTYVGKTFLKYYPSCFKLIQRVLDVSQVIEIITTNLKMT
jgi:hypothetical protein